MNLVLLLGQAATPAPKVSLLSLMKRSEPWSQINVIIQLLLMTMMMVALVRVMRAFLYAMGHGTANAIARFEAGETPTDVATDWERGAAPLLAWPHGLLAIGVFALSMGIMGYASTAVNDAVIFANANPEVDEFWDARANAHIPLLLGSMTLSFALMVYLVFAGLLTLAGTIGRTRLNAARPTSPAEASN